MCSLIDRYREIVDKFATQLSISFTLYRSLALLRWIVEWYFIQCVRRYQRSSLFCDMSSLTKVIFLSLSPSFFLPLSLFTFFVSPYLSLPLYFSPSLPLHLYPSLSQSISLPSPSLSPLSISPSLSPSCSPSLFPSLSLAHSLSLSYTITLSPSFSLSIIIIIFELRSPLGREY